VSTATPRAPRAQRGAALFVGLIVLILVTLISLAVANSTLLEGKMEAAQRNNLIAMQSAEAALRAAQAALTSGEVTTLCDPATSTLDISTGPSAQRDQFINPDTWPTGIGHTHTLTKSADKLNPARAPRYLIEAIEFNRDADDPYTGSETGAPAGGATGCGIGLGTGQIIFRITARGTGAEPFAADAPPPTNAVLEATVIRRR
jgi:Tfp pilus assembly protein PilX